jgi:pimeloyl-ACP methyl ester carboxylesterase
MPNVRISRRHLLIGGGCSAVAAALGIGAADHFDHPQFERGLYKVGLASSPTVRLPNSGAVEASGTFRSRYMNGPVNWTVSRPPGTQPLQGIIFCLHGKGTDNGTNQRFAFDAVHVPDAAAQVGLRVAVAGVDGGADSYWHPRQNGTNSLAMLLDEFVPMVRTMVGDLPQVLMGWSMGGYGALLAAERARSQFVAVVPASPALWLTPGATAPGAFDSPADFYGNDVFTGLPALNGMAIAVACGTSDPFYSTTRDLVAHMNYPHTDFFGPGFHDPNYWASVAPDQLRAIAPALT